MKLAEVMKIIQDDMRVAVFATVDQDGKPHARHAHIGVANEEGIFFMTSPETNFYKQMSHNPNVAITTMKEDGYLIQVVRIEGVIREIGRDRLQEVLKDNPYVHHVYPDEEDQAAVQVFHLYQGDVFYHSMTQGHKYVFSFGKN